MKRILFISTLSLITLVLLVIVGAGIFLTTLDLNDYKVRVEKAIKKSTGYQVVFEGDFTHFFFPLGLKTGSASIQDEDIYGSDPLLAVDNISLKANLFALLHGDIVIDDLSLDGLTVKLAVSATGRKNWELERQNNNAANVTPLKEERDASPSEELTNISGGIVKKKRFGLYIQSIHADNVKIMYKNLQNNSAWDLEKATGFIGNVGENKEMALKLAGDLIVNRHPARASIDATAQISSDKTVRVMLSSLKIANKESTGALPEVSTSASLFYDATLKNLSISDLEGTLNTMPFSGIFSVMLPGSPNLEKGLNWDIRGEAHLGSFYAEDMREKFTVLGLIPPQKKTFQRNSSVTITSGYAKKTSSLEEEEEEEEELASPLPDKGIEFLSHTFMAIDTTIERIAFKDAILENIKAKPLLSKGSFEMPYSLSSYGGKIEGAFSALFTEKEPNWKITAKATEIKAEFLPITIAKEKRIAGIITAQADLKGKGMSLEKMLPSVNGTTSFSMKKGNVSHSNILPPELHQLYKIPEEYPIENASFSSSITKGVATTSDIKLVSPLLNANGKGNVNFVNEAIRFDIDIAVKEAPLLPLLVRGTISKPAYTVDIESLARNTVVKKATAKITEKVETLEKKLGKKIEDKVKPKKLLQNLLKKL